MKNNLIKKRYFIVLFFTLVFIIYSVIHENMNRSIKKYLDEKTTQMYLKYQDIYEHHKDIAELVFRTEIDQPQIITLFKNRERKKLHQHLLANYKELRDFSVRQLHFHLPNNDSFLRMHRPLKFGDNLSKARLTVKYVNENKKYIDGFEEGKIFNGFRFVYPLLDNDKHLGSVEISFSALAFIKHIVSHYKIKANFLIDKSVVDQKVFKEEQSNYIQSPLPQYYLQKSIIEYVGMDLSKKAISNAQAEKIHENIQKGEPFSRYDKVLKEVVTYIPLKNPITKKVAAALGFRHLDISIGKEKRSSEIIFFTSVLIIGVILLLIYKELMYKKNLEKEVQDRTRELIALNEKLEEMAHVDPLTGAYNRRYFYEIAQEIISLTKREKKHLCLAMIDIDNFKLVNDTYGHVKGDEVLRSLVGEIKNYIRESDVLSRFGGEEFVLLFPNTDLKQALVISEKLRQVIASCTGVDGVSFTISIGISEFIIGKDDSASVLKRADEALYEAKNSGRNRVTYKI